MTIKSKSWIVPVIDMGEDELGFEIPDELLAMLDLKPGDTIIWEQRDEYFWIRKKQDE